MKRANVERRIEKLERRLSTQLSKLQLGNLSQFDEDALAIYCSLGYMDATMSPSYHDVEPTQIYARGEELRNAIYGPIIPAHQNTHLQRCTRASGEFELALAREPQPGDMLGIGHLYWMHRTDVYLQHFEKLKEAWQRRLPELTCPLKFENGQLFRRLAPSMRDEDPTWEEDDRIEPGNRWFKIPEVIANTNFETPETISSLVFLGVQNGKHRCRAPTPEEFERKLELPVGDAAFFKYAHQRQCEILIEVFGI